MGKNIINYLIEDIEFYNRISKNESLTLEIYVKNNTEPFAFSVQSKYSMRDEKTLMVEQISYNPPLRTVIKAEYVTSYSFTLYDDDEDAEEDGSYF